MHVINWKMERPDPDLVERFRAFAPAVLSDAMGRQNSMNHTMKPLWRGATVCGPALTVKSYACDNLMPHKAMQLAQPGDVIVIQANGHLEGALWGDLLSKSAKARGVEGAVMDAAVITPTVAEPVIMLPTTPNTNGRKIAGSPVEAMACAMASTAGVWRRIWLNEPPRPVTMITAVVGYWARM